MPVKLQTMANKLPSKIRAPIKLLINAITCISALGNLATMQTFKWAVQITCFSQCMTLMPRYAQWLLDLRLVAHQHQHAVEETEETDFAAVAIAAVNGDGVEGAGNMAAS